MSGKIPYNEKLDEREQIQVEEEIAALLFTLEEEVSTEIGRDALYIVLTHF